MQYTFLVIFIVFIFGILYIRSLWFASRIKKMQQVATDFSLTFTTDLHDFLGGYGMLFLFGKLDEVSGNLGGHNVRIIDGLRWHRKPQGLKNYSEFWIDEKMVGAVISWKKVDDLRDILKSISSGIIPEFPSQDLQGYVTQSLGIIVFGAIVLIGLIVWAAALIMGK